MTFVDHFLNFAMYGSLFGICVILIAILTAFVTSRRQRRRHRAAADRARGDVEAYPKKTSASA